MTTEIGLLDSKEVIEEGGKKKKGYKKYIEAIDRINLIGWVKDEIARKTDRTIVVKIDDIIKEMGPEFEKIGHSMLYQALKVIFFERDIFLSIGTHRDGDKVFVLREIRKGDKLPQSYSYTKQKVKEKINKNEDIDNKRNIEDIESHYDNLIKAITKERDDLLNTERKEKNALIAQVRKLKEMLTGKLGNNAFMVEVFQFNWDTLTWRMVKSKSVKTNINLLQIITDNVSKSDERYRIELTSLIELEKMGRQPPKEEFDNEKVERGQDIKDGTIEETDVGCPWCGSKNISKWSIIQVIRTRSGERKLRFRCKDCNETFGDEDIRIS